MFYPNTVWLQRNNRPGFVVPSFWERCHDCSSDADIDVDDDDEDDDGKNIRS